MLYLFQCVSVVVDLDHIVLIDPVDRTVGTSADLFATLNGDDPVSLHACDRQIRVGLFQMKKNAQTCTGNILELIGLDPHRSVAFSLNLGQQFLFHRGRVV